HQPSRGVRQTRRSRAVLPRLARSAFRPARGRGVPPTQITKGSDQHDGPQDRGDRTDPSGDTALGESPRLSPGPGTLGRRLAGNLMNDHDRERALAFDSQAARSEVAPVQSDPVALERLVRESDLPAGGLVLDAGCGPGLVSAALLAAGSRVVEVDLS